MPEMATTEREILRSLDSGIGHRLGDAQCAAAHHSDKDGITAVIATLRPGLPASPSRSPPTTGTEDAHRSIRPHCQPVRSTATSTAVSNNVRVRISPSRRNRTAEA